MTRVLLATRNAGKLVELRRMLTGIDGFEVVGLADVPEFPDAPETGATFTRRTLDAMLDVALRGIGELAAAQTAVLADPHPRLES